MGKFVLLKGVAFLCLFLPFGIRRSNQPLREAHLTFEAKLRNASTLIWLGRATLLALQAVVKYTFTSFFLSTVQTHFRYTARYCRTASLSLAVRRHSGTRFRAGICSPLRSTSWLRTRHSSRVVSARRCSSLRSARHS